MTQVLGVPVAEGVSLHVQVWPGERRPVLLVHGLASNARLWDGVAAALAEAGHAVATVDLRGHGRSDKPDGGYDFATVAADLAALVTALVWPEPLVVGQSWGGNVVLELAARHPALVGGVACVDGGWIDLRARFSDWESCARAMAPPVTEGRALADMEAAMRARHADWPETGIQGALACFEVREDGTVAPWLTLARHLAIVRAMWEQRVGDVYAAVQAPVLLLPCAPSSASVTAAWHERRRAEVAAASAALAASDVRWFVADHDVHAQHPGEVARVLMAAMDEGGLFS